MTTKTCITCKIIKDIDEFQYRTDTKKYRNQCKKCRQVKINEYRRTNENYKKRYNHSRKIKRETDPNYLLKERLRARLRKVIKLKNLDKCEATIKLLGCDIDFFKNHIESKFTGDMSWEKRNFELDHIIPCSSFDLSKVEEQRKCFHYTNIQPLTKEENMKKSNKIL